MKRNIHIAFLVLSMITSIRLEAQEMKHRSVALSDEQLVFSLFSDVWSGLPEEVEQDLINRGFSIQLFYDRPFSTSNFSMAFGLGWKQHNLYSNAYPVKDRLFGDGQTVFYTVPTRVGTKVIEYTLNKMSLGYLDIPVEFRYRSRSNLKFKASLGISGSVLLTSFTKYIGSDFRGNPDETVKWKRYQLPNVSPYTYTAIFRFGVRQWGFSASYQIPSVFRSGMGPDIRPLSFGLTYNPA